MDNPEPSLESEIPSQTEIDVLPPVEIEVDPFESIIDDVVGADADAAAEASHVEVPLEFKQELKTEVDVSEEKPKKKRGRPKKTRTYSKDSSSSNDDLPLKRKKSASETSDIKSENSQDETGKSRRSHRSTRPSSFISKYDTGSGSEDEKIPYKGAQLSDDEYTPDKESGKGKRKKRHDSVNGNSVRNLMDDLNAGDNSQDGMGLNTIKIESVSSMAEIKQKPKKSVVTLKSHQVDAASLFLTQVMKSTTNLGTFVQSKADEFISARLTPGFITDTNKLQFCMEKSFKLLELIKSNLKLIDKDLKQRYVEFVKQSKLEKAILQDKSTVKFLSEHKITFNKNGAMSCPEAGQDSDSDCEIVAEIPSTPKKSLDILRKVEKNGISWKKQRGSVSSECSDGSTKIQIPGHSAIFLNRNIKVKKVAKKPQFESFFREDGRTLKPPDRVNTIKTKFKIKKLEKTTLILGWLDLAYRKVSKQFFDIVREFERRKHYDSCSDLGESCSEDDVESEHEDEGIFCNIERNNDLQITLPKTLSKMCIDEINKAIRPSCIITYQMLEEQYLKSISSLRKYYSFADEIFFDNSKSASPDTLLKLCMDTINNTFNIGGLLSEHIVEKDDSVNPNEKDLEILNQTSLNCEENKTKDCENSESFKNSPASLKLLSLSVVQKLDMNELMTDKRQELILPSSIEKTVSEEEDDELDVTEDTVFQDEDFQLPIQELVSHNVLPESAAEETSQIENSEKMINTNSAVSSDSTILKKLLLQGKSHSLYDVAIKTEIIENVSEENQNCYSLLESTENFQIKSENIERREENIEIKAENILVEPDIPSADDNDYAGEDIPVGEDKLIESSEEDPMLQVTYEVYSKLDKDRYTKKSKKALEDLLQSSSSEKGGKTSTQKKKKKLVKRNSKKTKELKKPETDVPASDVQEEEKTIDEPRDKDGWTICNDMIGDIKLRQRCRVNLQRLPWCVLRPHKERFDNVEEDVEIEKLLDFSTLAPRTKTKQTDEEESKETSNKNKTLNSKRSKNKSDKNDTGLLGLITSGAIRDAPESENDEHYSENDTENMGDNDYTDETYVQSLVDDIFKNLNGPTSSLFDKFSTPTPSAVTEDVPEESIEKLVEKHKEKSNMTAKNLLILSSSDDSSSDNDNKDKHTTSRSKSKRKTHTKTKDKNFGDVQKSTHSKTTDKSVTKSSGKSTSVDDLVNILSSSDGTLSATEVPKDREATIETETMLEKLLRTPSKEPPILKITNEKLSHSTNQQRVVNEPFQSRKEKKKKLRKKKVKIVTESDEERRKFQKKRNRIVRKEEKMDKERQLDESSDNGSVLTMSSVESDLSADETLNTYQPSSQRPSTNTEYFTPIIKREPGLEHTPKAQRTKNRIGRPQLPGDSDDDTVNNGKKTSTKTAEMEDEDNSTTPKGRKHIRELLEDDCLLDTTKLAAKEEEERLKRLTEKNTQLSEIISFFSPSKESPESVHQNLILDADMETKEPLLSVHPTLVKIMKEHQMDGVKFMWDTCFESVKMVKGGAPGGGCILAHCMGLGKSLQVVALIHTLLSSDLPFRTVLICCPLSTVLNWADEFKKWLRKINCAKAIKIYELSKFRKHYERSFHLEDWHRTGGVFIIGYEMFRLLTNLKEAPDCKAHVIQKINATLLSPGPDIVVCDEGHLLKNDNTTLARVMNKIRSRRRIVLTGTPLQNNLKEYYCMVNFVKPSLLGSRKEYFNRFENPILNGQHRDSSTKDIQIMKKRSHVLHKMLEGCVQRKEATLLYKYLPRKREFVLLVTLSECQAQIYRHYLSKYAKGVANRGTPLLKDFHTLQKIWTHPRTLHKFFIKSRENKIRNRPKEKVGFTVDSDGVICLEDVGDVAEETLAAPDDTDWWMDYIDKDGMENLECSPKFTVALQLLDECLAVGDKMLIFSTSLFTLDALEFFLRKNKDWTLGKHYYRLDGSVTLENRQKWCRNFNSERNKDVKLFLISTRAGGLGINMIAANRVIIMDVSWNPSHDIQSIFRVYRFGQKKDCYIYRFVAMGTMEEKIYERSVTKQAISCRVVDEQQIDRHYNTAELTELYSFNPVPAGPQPVPSIPSDDVLATVLASSMTGNRTTAGDSNSNSKVPMVWSLHEHDSLLRDLRDEQLPEEERAAAWLEYQAEREQQKKQREAKSKQSSTSAAANNCIVPDRQLPQMHPLGARYKAPTYADMIRSCMLLNTNLTSGGGMISIRPNSVPNVRAPRPRILSASRPKTYTLGSYSTMLPLNNTQVLQHNPVPSTSNVNRPYAIQSTSYALPLSYEDTFNKFVDSANPPQLRNVHGDWVVPSSLSDLYKAPNKNMHQESMPVPLVGPPTTSLPLHKDEKKKSPSKKKKHKSPRKKTVNSPAVPSLPTKRLLNFAGNIYIPPIVNGYNSSDAESIVPDRDDSPVVTIEID